MTQETDVKVEMKKSDFTPTTEQIHGFVADASVSAATAALTAINEAARIESEQAVYGLSGTVDVDELERLRVRAEDAARARIRANVLSRLKQQHMKAVNEIISRNYF